LPPPSGHPPRSLLDSSGGRRIERERELEAEEIGRNSADELRTEVSEFVATFCFYISLYASPVTAI
jgi:hypothetical protein